MFKKLLLLATSGLVSLGLGLATLATADPRDEPPPPPKKKGEPGKEKKKAGPAGDVRKAYDLLRRIKSEDVPEGRREERLRDWTDRAVGLYRKSVKALEAGDDRVAREYGAAAHDLARAIDHARNASRFDRPDPDLPPPPDGPGPEDDDEIARRELTKAHDRIKEVVDAPDREAKFYLDAARDLYNAARRDVEGDRTERAAELARAAEAMTHVPEHLARASGDAPEPKEKKEKKEKKAKKADDPEPKVKKKADEKKAKKGDDRDDDLPPPLE